MTQTTVLLHADLIVRSMDVALEFYRDKLGFPVLEDGYLRGPLVRNFSDGCYDVLRLVIVHVSPGGAMIELVEYHEDSALIPDAAQRAFQKGWVAILVPDLRAHMRHLLTQGVHPTSEVFPVELPRSGAAEVVFYRDPDGNGLEFLQMKSVGHEPGLA